MEPTATTEDDPGVPDVGLGMILPVGLGLFSLGLVFGAVVVHAGLAWWWATVFTTIVYAGSLEFLLVGMAVSGVPLASVAMTSLLVNSRHVFYALSFPLHNVNGRAAKAYSTFALTDEAYAVTTSPEAAEWTSKRIIGLQVFFQLAWVGGGTLGALLGSVLPLDRLDGLDFALTALFLVLAIEAYRERPDPVTLALGVGSGVGALAIAPDHLLPVAFAAFTGAQIIRARRADPITPIAPDAAP